MTHGLPTVSVQPCGDLDGILVRLSDGRGDLMVIEGEFVELGVGEEMILQQGAGEGWVWQAGRYRDEGDQCGREVGDYGCVGEGRAPGALRYGSDLRPDLGTGPQPSTGGGSPSMRRVPWLFLSLSLLALALGVFADAVAVSAAATAAAAVWSGLEGRAER